jgi:hypothetical protein
MVIRLTRRGVNSPSRIAQRELKILGMGGFVLLPP